MHFSFDCSNDYGTIDVKNMSLFDNKHLLRWWLCHFHLNRIGALILSRLLTLPQSTIFPKELKTHKYEIKSKRLHSTDIVFYVSSFNKRRSQTFYKPVDVFSVTNAIGDSISLISIWNILNHLSSCRLVVDDLKERQLFFEQMNRNSADLIFDRIYWNCSTIENLRYLTCSVNELI